MKKAVWLAVILFIQIFLTTEGLPREVKAIGETNDYGGKSQEEIYSPEDDTFKKGIIKIIEHYDNKGKLRQIESYYNDEQINNDGIYKRCQYYEYSKFGKSILKQSHFFFSDQYSNTHGLSQSRIHYDETGHKTKEEFLYTGDFARRKVYSRIEVIYEAGKPEKRVFYDMNGKVLSVEEKKKIWTTE